MTYSNTIQQGKVCSSLPVLAEQGDGTKPLHTQAVPSSAKKRKRPYRKPESWNNDMSKAPKGKWVNETRKTAKGKQSTVRVFYRDEIWVKGSCGTVTRSYWIPDEKRWCFFVKDKPPVAWAEFTGERV